MTVQFTSRSLARLLRNVERKVLVDAISEADLWDVFSSFERGVLIELGGAFNFIANLNTFASTGFASALRMIRTELWTVSQRPETEVMSRLMLRVLVWIMDIQIEQLELNKEIRKLPAKFELFVGSEESGRVAELERRIGELEANLAALEPLTEDLHGLAWTADEQNIWQLQGDVDVRNFDTLLRDLHRLVDTVWGRVRARGGGALPSPRELTTKTRRVRAVKPKLGGKDGTKA
ncbi:hypothetical protein LCGC14_2371820 [marine sediment metagenome]|uniref:Uncharacterized protein n=1 Tax=marine sediment metagenome TaxID=412755 RepID=A0A0F9C3J7_9ZZZZ